VSATCPVVSTTATNCNYIQVLSGFLNPLKHGDRREGRRSEDRCSERQFISYYRDETKFIILKVPKQCPLVLLVKV